MSFIRVAKFYSGFVRIVFTIDFLLLSMVLQIGSFLQLKVGIGKMIADKKTHFKEVFFVCLMHSYILYIY